MVAPLALAVRFRWFIRLGLIGYAVAAIVGWFLTGPRYDVAYLAKAIEVVLIRCSSSRCGPTTAIRSAASGGSGSTKRRCSAHREDDNHAQEISSRCSASPCSSRRAAVAVASASTSRPPRSTRQPEDPCQQHRLRQGDPGRAGERPFILVFDNEENVGHNVSIYSDAGFQTRVFEGSCSAGLAPVGIPCRR
jgi:hypothetical protein